MTRETTGAGTALGGIGLVLAAMFIFAGMDGLSKALAERYHVFQISLARYLFTVLFLLPAVFAAGTGAVFRTGRAGLLVLRGLCMLGSALFFIAALGRMPIADATAISFLSPAIVTALSIPLLREQVGWRRWVAIAVGFAGVLVIVRPGTAAFDPAALLPIGSAACWALGLVLTRMLHGSDGTLTMVIYMALTGLVVSLFLGVPVWIWPDATGWLLMAGMGMCSASAQVLLARAHAMASASLLAPFSYSQMIWASLIGYFAFGHLPDAPTWVGASVIIASGLYILHRERVRARRGHG